MEQNSGNQQKTDSKIQAMEMTFLGPILNKTEKNRIRNINIRLERGGGWNKKNDNETSRFR